VAYCFICYFFFFSLKLLPPHSIYPASTLATYFTLLYFTSPLLYLLYSPCSPYSAYMLL